MFIPFTPHQFHLDKIEDKKLGKFMEGFHPKGLRLLLMLLSACGSGDKGTQA